MTDEQTEIDRLRAIVEAIANLRIRDEEAPSGRPARVCPGCDMWSYADRGEPLHAPSCPWLAARAYVEERTGTGKETR